MQICSVRRAGYAESYAAHIEKRERKRSLTRTLDFTAHVTSRNVYMRIDLDIYAQSNHSVVTQRLPVVNSNAHIYIGLRSALHNWLILLNAESFNIFHKICRIVKVKEEANMCASLRLLKIESRFELTDTINSSFARSSRAGWFSANQ